MSSILVVAIDQPSPPPLQSLCAFVEATFGVATYAAGRRSLDLAVSHDLSRNQYYSTKLIKDILTEFPEHTGKILAITEHDLFVPVLSYVFGEAQLDGKVAVVSSFRFDEQLYGYPSNPTLADERLLKVSIHEIGHTFGLIHCPLFECVMHSSTTVEEIDLKRTVFCPECRTLLDTKTTDRD